MKNQYFADRRDFFKWDLLLDLVESQGTHRRLTYIPMLTPNDGSQDGKRTAYEHGSRRPLLYDALRQAVNAGRRDIRVLRELMPALGVEFKAYRDEQFVEAGGRDEYFASIPLADLTNTLLFFDPDTGLETGSLAYMRKSGETKYLLHSELSSVLARVPGNSLVVIYQHLQWNADNRHDDVVQRLQKMEQQFARWCWSAIRDQDLAFLVGSCDHDLAAKADAVLSSYARRHGLFWFPSGPGYVSSGNEGGAERQPRSVGLSSPRSEVQMTCRFCDAGIPADGPRRCPECGHQFRGRGWEGIDAHWKAKHSAVASYEEFWASVCDQHRGSGGGDVPSHDKGRGEAAEGDTGGSESPRAIQLIYGDQVLADVEFCEKHNDLICQYLDGIRTLQGLPQGMLRAACADPTVMWDAALKEHPEHIGILREFLTRLLSR